jgi:hypothetical protein
MRYLFIRTIGRLLDCVGFGLLVHWHYYGYAAGWALLTLYTLHDRD